MMCLTFSVAVLCLTLAGLCLMVGWRKGAAQLARVAVALVIASAVFSWCSEVVQAFFARPQVTTVVGGLLCLVVLTTITCAVVWCLKRPSASGASSRPTLRRRAPLAELAAETPRDPSPWQPPSVTKTDELQLFDGGQ
jgi:hypothetical protein